MAQQSATPPATHTQTASGGNERWSSIKWGLAASALGGATYLALRSWASGVSAWSGQPVLQTDFDSFLVKPGEHPTGLTPGTTTQKKTKRAAPRRDGNGGGPFECFLKVTEEQEDKDEDVRNPVDFNSFLKSASRKPNAQLAAAGAVGTASPSAAAEPARPLPHQARVLVLFGTEYGFSKEIAEKLCAQLRAAGSYWPVLRDMADSPEGMPGLAQEQAVLVACSTQGDGVPPTEARGFCEWLFAGKAGDLSGVKFSVCALGDRSYQHFCRCGRLMDEALGQAGAARLSARADVNREDWPAVDAWLQAVVAALGQAGLRPVGKDAGGAMLSAEEPAGHAGASRRWGRSRPYPARVLAVQPLCQVALAEDKNTVRVELQLGDGGDASLQYLPGDALGLYPSNAPKYVEQLLAELGAPAATPMPTPAWHVEAAPPGTDDRGRPSTLPLREALLHCYDLKTPKAELFQLLWQALPEAAKRAADAAANGNGAHVNGDANGHINGHTNVHGHVKDDADAATAQAMVLAGLLAGGPEAQDAYLSTGRHVVDVLKEFGAAQLTWKQVLGTMRQLQPRLYSISSAPGEAAGHVQATIAEVRYQALGAERVGVCSTYVSQRIQVGQLVPAYIHRNPDFRLPASLSTPIIMVGPGTGLAPFRSFILQRIMDAGQPWPLPGAAAGAATQQQQQQALGEMVLFFGCRRPDQDYLYCEELQALAAAGLVTLHTAFSRLEAKKVYVQDRLKEQAVHVWQLLDQQGAHFYVCGDASSMAGAVEQQLLRIIAGGLAAGTAEAQAYLDKMSSKGRYQRDVWY